MVYLSPFLPGSALCTRVPLFGLLLRSSSPRQGPGVHRSLSGGQNRDPSSGSLVRRYTPLHFNHSKDHCFVLLSSSAHAAPGNAWTAVVPNDLCPQAFSAFPCQKTQTATLRPVRRGGHAVCRTAPPVSLVAAAPCSVQRSTLVLSRSMTGAALLGRSTRILLQDDKSDLLGLATSLFHSVARTCLSPRRTA